MEHKRIKLMLKWDIDFFKGKSCSGPWRIKKTTTIKVSLSTLNLGNFGSLEAIIDY